MNGIDRNAAPQAEESVKFWQHPRFNTMGLLKARFRRHSYELHTHPSFVIAVITDGCERVRIGRAHEVASAGTVLVVAPEECHDGRAGGSDGWTYRVFYPAADLMAELARELGHPSLPSFRQCIADDPALVRELACAHRIAEAGIEDEAEVTALLAFRSLISRHTGSRRTARPTPDPVGSARRVAVYRDMIESDPTRRLELARLADATNVTRFQVIRDFKQVTGFTPTAFIRDRRLRSAIRSVQAGQTLANAAASAGFSDQSHLCRAFKQSHGFTPGVLRRASGNV